MENRYRQPRAHGRILFVLATLLALCAASAAADVDPFYGYADAGVNSLGGYHAARADDFSVLFSNPAGLAAVKPTFSAARLDLAVSGPVFDLANIFLSGSNIQTEVLNFLAANGFSLYTGVDLSGPISLGYVGNGLGFGIFQRTKLVIDAEGLTSIKVGVAEDLLINGGYAFSIPTGPKSALDIGVVAKGYVRGEMLESGGILEFSNLLGNFTAILNQPFTLTTGIGLDAGLRWGWNDIFAVGLACRDAYSPCLVSTYSSVTAFAQNPAAALQSSTPDLIPRDLYGGISVKPPLGVLGRVLDSASVYLDYDRILDLLQPIARNAILNVEVGVELRALQILSVRMGVRDALPQAGVDLDLDFAKIGVNAWGTELGLEPGERSIYNLEFSFDFVY